MDSLSSLLPVIQLAITPVILLSGMGALMLTLTNRMGRIVDLTRSLAEAMSRATGAERAHLEGQLGILWKRSLLIRRSVTANGLSMLSSCVLVIVLGVTALFHWNLGVLVLLLFTLSVLLLIASLVEFLREIFMSLHALHMQVEWARRSSSS